MTISLAGLTLSNGLTSTTPYSSFLSSSDDSSWTNYEEIKAEYITPQSACPILPLSDQYEEILVIQSLRTYIEPNHQISEVVSRAIVRHEERINQQSEIVENEFKSINDEIEHRILNASRILNEHLNAVDVLLTNILENWKLDDITRFDMLKRCFENVDELVAGRNQNIDNFMNTLRDLEKERTTLIESCFKRHMLAVKQLSPDSFERLYEKYLQNYNTIKLGNFRTYENLRFKLVQLSRSHQRDYAIRAHEVKLNIKKIMGEGFVDKFKKTAQTIISDKMSTIQTKFMSLLDDFNELFNELIQMSEEQINFSIVSKCWDSFRTNSKKLDELVGDVVTSQARVTDGIRSVLDNTAGEFDAMVADSGEYLSRAESAAVIDAMSTESEAVLTRLTETVADVRSLFHCVRSAATAIETVFGPAVEAMRSHSSRVAGARNVILTAVEKKMKTNDMKFNVFENNFHLAFTALLKASTQVEVRKFEQKCVMLLKHIKNRVIVNREGETEVILNYKDLMIVELNVTRSAIQKILNLVPHDLKTIPELKNEPWSTSVKQLITDLKTTAKNCHQAICNRLTILISELKSSALLNNECMWIAMLKYNIDERYDKAIRFHEVMKSKVQGGTADKRIDEINQHKNVLNNLMKTAKDTSESLMNKTNALYDMFEQKKNVILNNVKLIKSNINEFSVFELTDLMNQLQQQVDLVSDTFYSSYESLFKNVKSEYQAIEKRILELQDSIKTFSEGGNFSQEEAENYLNILIGFRNTTLQNKTVIIEIFKRKNYQSVTDVKKLLSKMIKPAVIELDKKLMKQKHIAINKLMRTNINQELFNLEKMIESLHKQLEVFKKTLVKEDVIESSKGWSEILLGTNTLIGFLIESYTDIKALLKSQIVNSIWNTKNEKAYIMSNVNVNSNNMFFNGKFKFYNYCKTIVASSEKIDSTRFLNNIYLSIFHYISESQHNAAVLTLLESKSNNFINEQSNMMQIYYEIMEEAVKKSKEKMLQLELIWIFKLSDVLEFLNDIYVMESQFKNSVLMFYHKEAVLNLNKVFDEFTRESEFIRKRWKIIREEFCNRLKPSHGHPDNILMLEVLLDNFKQIHFECSETLSNICSRIENNLYTITDNYEKEFPIDILKGATLFIKCESNLRTQLGNINLTPSNSRFDPKAISEPLATSITDKNSIELAVSSIKQNLQSDTGTVIWPNNQKLWKENVHKFVQLCRDRRDDVRTFNAVEKTKLVDWATIFVRNVERVKGLHQRHTEVSAAKGYE